MDLLAAALAEAVPCRMAQGLERFVLGAQLLSADGAVHHLAVAAVFGAEGVHYVLVHRIGGGVAQGLALRHAAARTGLRLGAGGVPPVVAERLERLAAAQAGPALGAGELRHIVAQRLAPRFAAALTGARLGAGGVLPVVAERLTLRLAAALTGARLRAGGVPPVVAERLALRLLAAGTPARLGTGGLGPLVRMEAAAQQQ